VLEVTWRQAVRWRTRRQPLVDPADPDGGTDPADARPAGAGHPGLTVLADPAVSSQAPRTLRGAHRLCEDAA